MLGMEIAALWQKSKNKTRKALRYTITRLRLSLWANGEVTGEGWGISFRPTLLSLSPPLLVPFFFSFASANLITAFALLFLPPHRPRWSFNVDFSLLVVQKSKYLRCISISDFPIECQLLLATAVWTFRYFSHSFIHCRTESLVY